MFTSCTGLTVAAVGAFLSGAQLRHQLRVMILEDQSLNTAEMEAAFEALKGEMGAHRTWPSFFID
jgi:hypothetical protein